MNKTLKKALSSLLALALVLSCVILPGTIVSADADDVEASFAATLGQEVGETLINDNYSSMTGRAPVWLRTDNNGDLPIQEGKNKAAKGLYVRKNDNSGGIYYRFCTRAFPEGNFVAKFTAYSTHESAPTSKVDTYIGICNSDTATADDATYIRIYKDNIAGNKTENYADGKSLGYSELSAKYDLDVPTKAYTFYIFAVDGKYYFVDLDGKKLFEYQGDASYFFFGVDYAEATLTEFTVKELRALQVANIEDIFASSIGAEVGATLINRDYTTMEGTRAPDWLRTDTNGDCPLQYGKNELVRGVNIRDIDSDRFCTTAFPEGNFVAKFTAYSTPVEAPTKYVDTYIGICNSDTATEDDATYIRIYKEYIADNKTRNYADGASVGYSTLSDKYDLDDPTKPYTFYIFAVNDKYYFVDLDGKKLFEYQGEASYFFFGVSYAEVTLTEFTVKELIALADVEITYDANDGKFSDGTASATITEEIGSEFTAEVPSRENHRFLGWSTERDGEVLTNTTATAKLNGATLYAVWQVAHPEDADYTTGSVIDVDFSNWERNGEQNSYYGKDAEENKVYYFTDGQTEEGDGEGDTYLRFDATSVTSTVPGLSFYPNYALTMTDGGTFDDTLILPNDTTFKLTLRVRINELNGATAELRVFYTYGSARNSANGKANSSETLLTGIGETNGEWVDIVTYFTTPKEYSDNDKTSGNICDKVYIMLGPSTSALVQYDITNVKVEYASKASLYYELNGETILYDTLYGTPGETLKLPESSADEFYSDEDATGGIKTYNFDTWYFGADSTEEPVAKFGDVDTNLYCKDISIDLSSTENQDGYCGFDLYEEQLDGYSIDSAAASILTDTAYTGKKSMLVSADTAFEIRNDNAIGIYKGKTYKVSFFYKSDAALSVGVGVGKANSIPTSAAQLSSVSLEAANAWTKATVYVTVPEGVAEGYALALIANINAETYFDNISVSSATSSVGAEKEDENFRFMFTYDADASNQDTIIIDDERFTVVERGILVKHSGNSADLIKENYGKNGVVGTVRSEMDDCFTNNSVTGSIVFSVLVEGAAKSDKFSARGYVVLNDGTVYYSDVTTTAYSDIADRIKTVPTIINKETAYVYLPEGTVLSNGVPSATFNNEFFIEETGVVSNGVMQKGAYVNFAQDTSFNDITVPAELYYTVEVGTKKQLYYGPDVALVRKQLDSVSDDTVNYIFITDIHYKNYGTASVPKEEHDGPMDRQLERIVKLANESDAIDFIVVGGDTTTGMYSTAESAMDATEAALSPFKNCTKPVLVLMGNHDDNSYGDIRTSSDETLISTLVSDKYWNDRILDVYSPNVVHNTKYANSKYYYYDLANKKTRVICLDSSDYEAEYDADGVVTGLKLLDESSTKVALKYRTGHSFYGFSERQLKWLAEEALTAADDWNYIFVSHMEMDARTDNKTPVLGNEMKNVMAAYQNKTRYTFDGEELDIDVTFTGSGKIMSYQHGHVHLENITYRDDLDIFVFASDTANLTQTDNVEIKRIYMTNTEASFNVMSVRDESVYKMNVGAGKTVECYDPN